RRGAARRRGPLAVVRPDRDRHGGRDPRRDRRLDRGGGDRAPAAEVGGAAVEAAPARGGRADPVADAREGDPRGDGRSGRTSTTGSRWPPGGSAVGSRSPFVPPPAARCAPAGPASDPGKDRPVMTTRDLLPRAALLSAALGTCL